MGRFMFDTNVRAEFNESRSLALNPAWIGALVHVANTAGGLYLVPEPAARARHDTEKADSAAPFRIGG